jgi:hypothetical protein
MKAKTRRPTVSEMLLAYNVLREKSLVGHVSFRPRLPARVGSFGTYHVLER